MLKELSIPIESIEDIPLFVTPNEKLSEESSYSGSNLSITTSKKQKRKSKKNTAKIDNDSDNSTYSTVGKQNIIKNDEKYVNIKKKYKICDMDSLKSINQESDIEESINLNVSDMRFAENFIADVQNIQTLEELTKTIGNIIYNNLSNISSKPVKKISSDYAKTTKLLFDILLNKIKNYEKSKEISETNNNVNKSSQSSST